MGQPDLGSYTSAERVGGTVYVDVALSLDASGAYAAGEVLADTQLVANAFRTPDGAGLLQSVVVTDEDDQGVSVDLVFLSGNASLGTENGALAISDAGARNVLGIVSVSSGDYVDLGGARVATLRGIGLPVRSAPGSKDMYVGAITRGAPTHSASGLRLRLGFVGD